MAGWLLRTSPRNVEPDRQVVMIKLLTGVPLISGTRSSSDLQHSNMPFNIPTQEKLTCCIQKCQMLTNTFTCQRLPFDQYITLAYNEIYFQKFYKGLHKLTNGILLYSCAFIHPQLWLPSLYNWYLIYTKPLKHNKLNN